MATKKKATEKVISPDDIYVNEMHKSFKLYWKERKTSQHTLYDVMRKYYKSINRNIITKFLDIITTKKLVSQVNKKYFHIFNFDEMFQDSYDYNWLTYNIILMAIKIGQSINHLPERYITHELICIAVESNSDNIRHVPKKLLENQVLIKLLIEHTRSIIPELELTNEYIDELIKLYPDTIKFLKNIDYDKCQKSYLYHGKKCIKYIPDEYKHIIK